MDPQLLHWGAWLVTPILAGGSAWWGTSVAVARLEERLAGQADRLAQVAADLREQRARVDRLLIQHH